MPPPDEPLDPTRPTGLAAGRGTGDPAAPVGRRGWRDHRRGIAIGAVVVAVATGLGVVLATGDAPKAAPKPTTTTSTSTTVPGSVPSIIATSRVSQLKVFSEPTETSEVVTTLSQRTDYGLVRTLLVNYEQPGWLNALVPIRPNGSRGWIRESDVTLSSTDYQVLIEVGAHKITLFQAGTVVLESPVIVGKDQTPTPLGRFYVTDPVDLQSNPNSTYGAFALGISGYSEVLLSFQGGPGQIAVHGTNRPDQVGQNLSNGCIRVPNEHILEIARLVPLGTPVDIVA